MKYMEIGRSGIRASVITFGGMGIGGGTWWRGSEDEESIRTLHRAFDMCRDAYEALDQAAALGIRTILTSGQKENSWAGRELIAGLVKESGGRVDIMAGGGVDAGKIRELIPATGAGSYHMSGKVVLDSGMVYRREEVSMGVPGMGEYEIFRTSEAKIREAREVLDEY